MAFVQTANSGTPSGTATSKSATFASAQTAGNLNVVVISFGNIGGPQIPATITSVTDTKGNSYSAVTTAQVTAATQELGQIIYAASGIVAATAGANAVTVVISAAASFFTVVACEYSGLATSSPVDTWSGTSQNATASTVAATPSLTTTVASDTLFAGFSLFDGPAGTLNLTAGFTQRANFYTQVEADRVGVTIGSYSCSATASGTSGWVAQLVAFKPAGATGQSITPSGIASTNAFGTAVVSPGAVAITPTGIASTNAFGTAVVSPGAVGITPAGIASTNAFGVAVVSPGAVAITPTGIASTNAFGTATLSGGSITITPVGIASTNAFGSAALATGPVNIAPTGIASTIAFGTAAVARVLSIAPSGIASTLVFGNATVTRGAVNLAPSGIASSIAFGTATILQPSLQGISATGIGSTTAFGVATILAKAREQPVPPYTGQEQPIEIDVPAWIAYREQEREEGPWVMPPYALIFPQAVPPPPCERGTDQFHHEWLKTHPRPPRHHGEWRPKSVLAPFVRAQPIKPKGPIKCPH